MFDGVFEQSAEYDGDAEDDGQHPHNYKCHTSSLTIVEPQPTKPSAAASGPIVTIKEHKSAAMFGSTDLDDGEPLARDGHRAKNGK